MPLSYCTFCGTSYIRKQDLNRHIRETHNGTAERTSSLLHKNRHFEELTTPTCTQKHLGVIHCNFCGTAFTQKQNLNRHIREIHNGTVEPTSYESALQMNRCCEDNCNISFRMRNDLRHHLQTVHGYILEKEELTFNCWEEFSIWLHAMEEKNSVSYFWHSTTPLLSKNHQTIYFYCNRSGNTPTVGERSRKRSMKSQGSRKMGMNCISSIIVTKKLESQHCSVVFYKTHYGHSIELQHINLTHEDKASVAAKLISGVTPNRILQTVRANIQVDTLRRGDLLTKQDITNIKRANGLNITDGVHHPNDAVSVDLWVQECQTIEDGILFYKKQEEDHPQLDVNDFILIFMNNSQKIMLEKFGSNTVCIDGTHGLNSYDFELTTLMIIDEHGEGYPVCCMFSNRKDTIVYEIMFDQLKLKVGIISPSTFMSDLAPVYYNAWVNVMGPVTNYLYCSWHVDQAWRNNLVKICKMEKRNLVYKSLKVLQMEVCASEFIIELNTFINLLLEDEDTLIFANYFKTNYCKNYRQWAYCFRKGCGINTNMRLEAMHKILKHFHLGGTKVKRLDKGLHAVLSYIRNKTVERIIKNIKGKNTHHIQDINNRHKLALANTFNVTESEEGTFLISNIDKSSTYIITSNKDMEANFCCALKCSLCTICVHKYRCTCVDYFIKATICKHIHYINMQKNEISKQKVLVDNNCQPSEVRVSVGNRNLIMSDGLDLNDEVKNHLKTLAPMVPQDRDHIVAKIQDACINILYGSDLRKLDDDVITHTSKTLTILANLIRRNENSIMYASNSNQGNHEPANKKIVQQVRFKTTKKKRGSRLNVSLSKPNAKEVINIQNTFKGMPFVSTDSNLDHNYCKKFKYNF